MRRFIKILHEVGTVGVMGAIAAIIILIMSARGTSSIEYAAIRHGIDHVARWLLLPSLGAEEVRAQYIAVRQRGLVEESPSQPEAQVELAARAPEAAQRARRAVRALWEGDVAPRPTRESMCWRCDARDVCRRPAVMPITVPICHAGS